MKKLILSLCLLALASVCSADVLVSSQGILNDPNGIFEQSFTYNPLTQGGTIIIQTYGYGGSANGNVFTATGRNLAGNIISAGGFDPIVTLFAGAAGGGGARIAFNDDGTCAPRFGTADVSCFDSTLQLTGLAAGTYTIALSAFANFAGATETTPFTGGGSFTDVNARVRTNQFAVDVASVPEPMTFGLMGAGLLGLGLLRRRMKK
jgi:hypothetical protein